MNRSARIFKLQLEAAEQCWQSLVEISEIGLDGNITTHHLSFDWNEKYKDKDRQRQRQVLSKPILL